MIFQQRLAYDALAAAIAPIGLTLLVGEPASIQTLPGCYLVSTVIEVPPNRALGVGTAFVSRLRPTVTLVVARQDASAAEYQIIDLVDQVSPFMFGPLADVCRSSIETVSYGWRAIGGIEYRVADLSLVLSQM
jgi:hypothetical protein